MQADPHLVQALYQRLLAEVPGLDARQTAWACNSLAQLGTWDDLPLQLHTALLTRVWEQLPSMDLRSAVNCVWGCARLVPAASSADPPAAAAVTRMVQHVVRSLSRQQLAACCYPDLAQLAAACALVSVLPTNAGYIGSEQQSSTALCGRVRVLKSYVFVARHPHCTIVSHRHGLCVFSVPARCSGVWFTTGPVRCCLCDACVDVLLCACVVMPPRCGGVQVTTG